MSETISSATAPRPARRSRLLKIVLLAVLILVVAFARFAYLRMTREPTPRPEYWETQIAALDPPPAGAISAEEARRLLTSRPWETLPPLNSFTQFDPGNLLLEGRDKPYLPEAAAVDKVFRSAPFTDARGRMGQACQRGWYIPYPLDQYDAIMADYRRWAKWLTVHSRWACGSGNDPAAAVEDWLTTLRMCRQMVRPRMTILWLVDAAIEQLVAEEMFLANRENKLGSIDTAALARAIDEILGPVPPPSRRLAGERMNAHNMIELVFVRQGGDWLVVSTMGGKYASYGTAVGMGPAGSTPGRIWNLTSPLFYDIHTARRIVDEYYPALDRCTDLVACERAEADWRSKAPTALVPPDVLCGMLDNVGALRWSVSPQPVPSEISVTRHYLRLRSMLDAAVAMLALDEYYRRNGRFPERLDQLVPNLLPRLPIDYADRKPLRYRRTAFAYVLYSIGDDGEDNGGVSGRNPRLAGSFNSENPDVVFTDLQRREPQK